MARRLQGRAERSRFAVGMWPTRLESLPRLDRRGQLIAISLVLVLLALVAGFTWLSVIAAGRHAAVSSSVVPAPALWVWNGHSYIEMERVGGGPASNQIDMAYDRGRGTLIAWDHGCVRIVMGFTGGCAERVDRTWAWDGRTWQSKAGSGPIEAGAGAMFFDGQPGEVVYINGAGAGWAWDGDGWKRISWRGAPAVAPPGSPAAAGFAAGYEEDHQLLVFAFASRTWTFDGYAWSAHDSGIETGELEQGGGLVNDGGGLLYVGRRSTWTWDGTRWTRHDLPRMARAGLTYDGTRVVGVGEDASIWTWSGGSWSQAVVPIRPEVRVRGVPPVAFDEATGVTLALL